MKRFVSFNYKFFKHSNRNTLGHNGRIHKNIENARADLKHHNISSGNVISKYQSIYDDICKKKGKRIQSNANTFIDGVLAFSNDRVNALIKEFGREKTFQVMDRNITKYMEMLRDEFGFEPVGYDFHCDEGHWEGDKWIENYHAHIIMFNYDMENGVAPLRKMMGKSGKRSLSKMQTLAGEAFKGMGFIRGISKEITKKKHLEKDEWIDKAQSERIEKLNTLKSDIDKYKGIVDGIDDRIYALIDDELDYIRRWTDSMKLPDAYEKQFLEFRDHLKEVTSKDRTASDALQYIISCLDREKYQSIYESIEALDVKHGNITYKNKELYEIKDRISQIKIT